MKKLVLIVALLSPVMTYAIPNCLTNVSIYCTGNNLVSTTQGGTTSAPTNELHGVNLVNGPQLNFYGTCSSSSQVVAVLIVSCDSSWCNGSPCNPGSHESNITLDAYCDIVSGYLSPAYGNCCTINFGPPSCHPCTPAP